MKKLFISIWNDCKSWQKIKVNRWHLHAPIAFVSGWFLYGLLHDSIFDLYEASQMFFRLFIPSFLGLIALAGFEAFQGKGRIIGELERFESNKDLIVGEIFLILGVILSSVF